MPHIAVYRFFRRDQDTGVDSIDARMATALAISTAGYDIIEQDVMDVPVDHIDAEGFTSEGYWDRFKPPLYL
ncbi:hypothetical protein MMA231_03158 [Asticcacaulis sp. MM231]|uniref:hypothetical protein n=1 Tax=Asticcacaulis sp. MM231 TaxID=3157666 RepID=UPI0032D56B8B